VKYVTRSLRSLGGRKKLFNNKIVGIPLEGMSAVQLGRQGVKELARVVSPSGTHLLGDADNQIKEGVRWGRNNNYLSKGSVPSQTDFPTSYSHKSLTF
jgi:hypothetical protein